MKKSEPKPKQTNNHPKAPRNGAAAAVAAPKEAPNAQPEKPRPAADGALPIPNLAQYGVSEAEARTHVAQCEPCGRAHKHVVKNPKDTMALDSFGRHIASCIAVNQKSAPAAAAAR